MKKRLAQYSSLTSYRKKDLPTAEYHSVSQPQTKNIRSAITNHTLNDDQNALEYNTLKSRPWLLD